MNTKEMEDMLRQMERLNDDTTLSEGARLNALYAYVEQKVRNSLVRDYNRDWQCPICGAEKPSR